MSKAILDFFHEKTQITFQRQIQSRILLHTKKSVATNLLWLYHEASITEQNGQAILRLDLQESMKVS